MLSTFLIPLHLPVSWSLTLDHPRTLTNIQLFRESATNSGSTSMLVDAYEHSIDYRQEVWTSGNKTVPTGQPLWVWYLESEVDEQAGNSSYLGPLEFDGNALPLLLNPGGIFLDEVYFSRDYLGFQSWTWTGSQTTVRRRDRWWEQHAARLFELSNPEVGGDGGGDH